MKVGVVGLGYAGLCTAACLAGDFDLIGVDVDSARISTLNQGQTPIHETGLESLLRRGLAKGTLTFSDDYDSLRGAQVVFVTVGTPPNQDGSIDLSQVRNASEHIGRQVRHGKRPLVVIKSTVTPGTTSGTVKPILEKESGTKCGEGFGLCSNPEFLREGAAVNDTFHPDRIVIGPSDERSGKAMRSFYREFYSPKQPPIVETTPENAELIKYASNTFLATKISFINFIARVCQTVPGADVNVVASAMGLDPRIGERYLQAGPGFGGACFPKDTRALSSYAEQRALDDSLLVAVMQINDTQPGVIASEVERAVGSVSGKEIAILGAAFKEASDDVRESRAILLAKMLAGKGASVRITDPQALDGAKKELGKTATYHEDVRTCIRGADAAVVMTPWSEFKKLKPVDYLKLMRTPVLFDARRLYDPAAYRIGGLKFMAIGLGASA